MIMTFHLDHIALQDPPIWAQYCANDTSTTLLDQQSGLLMTAQYNKEDEEDDHSLLSLSFSKR